MHSIDITRNGFAPAKRYAGVLHTQGSVLLDADQNDGELIDRQDERRTITDLLVTAGSPDDGFRIGPPAAAGGGYNFELDAGTFYLGGIRLELPQPEQFRLQSEWLQMRDTGAVPGPLANEWLPATISAVPNAPPAAARTDLVWLEAWDQAVTGTEDGELVETALGVDSAARLRAMRKVHVFPNAGGTCGAGFAALVAALEATGRFDYVPDTHQLKSNRRMQVGFIDIGAPADPCTPAQRRGFLGADNETIQVRVIADNRFIWSVGNAAPLYRVTLAGQALHFVSPPRDALLRPLAGDVIELVRSDAILPNGERIGEHHGLFFRVLTSFDPATGNVGLDADPLLTPGPFPNDTARATTLHTGFGLPGAPDAHFYARVWRGETIAAAPAGKAFAGGTAVPLGNTGLTVTFTGNGPVGDSWTFSARPNTPELIAPWEMLRPSPPTAPHRFIAGLGLIKWPGGSAAPEYTDCRRRVRKLEYASSCCEVTVGDNQESFGDVSSVAAALARLPAGGGKICLLRGNFTETISLVGRQNIVVEGCGRLTRLRGDPANSLPVIGITDCERITVRCIQIEARDRIAVAIDDTGTGDFGENTQGIVLEKLGVTSRDAPAVLFNGGEGLDILETQVALEPISAPTTGGSIDGMASALLLFGARMRVERCRVEGQPNSDRASLPVGGIHIIGGSEQVELRRNVIAHTTGTGIVLGSVTMVEEGSTLSDLPLRTRLPKATGVGWMEFATAGADPTSGYVWFFVVYIVSADGCTQIPVLIPGYTGDDGTEYVPDADPFIVGCRIIDNDIMAMGENGIGPFAQFDLSEDPQFCGVAGLEIRKNRIRGCVRNEPPQLADGSLIFTGRGGIVLGWAEDLDIVDNVIESNGANRNAPVCGIFAAGLSHGRFSRNTIHGNGMRMIDLGVTPMPGQRGGIVIRSVVPGLVPFNSFLPSGMNIGAMSAWSLQSGREALMIQGNSISSPEGRALQVSGTGAMSITGNQLASLGAAAASAFWQALASALVGSSTAGTSLGSLASLKPFLEHDPFATVMGNAVVSVLNTGISSDISKLLPFSVGFGFASTSGGTGSTEVAVTTGRVLFSDNQTRFDGLALPVTIVPVLVGLVSLDDVTMADNQCDADFLTNGLDWPLVHGAVISLTGRMTSNRFSEPDIGLPATGMFQQLSGLHVGSSVFMHHNFGSHCFLGIPFKPAMSVLEPNHSMIGSDVCQRHVRQLDGLLAVLVRGTGTVGAGRIPGEKLDSYGSIAIAENYR
ncbi:MAG: DUF6519 domain-containing protein [Croceibacterium sp.]